VSSYDRSGGNNDGFDGQFSFVRKEKDGLVLADLSGPGVIYRISTPTPTDDLLEFYFDGEEQPRIQVPFRELVLGTHPAFPHPLVGYGAGGFYCYVPLPYEKSCKVFIRAERVQFYQLNYATYPEGHGIQSFRAEPSAELQQHIEKAQRLFATARTSAYVVPAGQGQRFTSRVTLRVKNIHAAGRSGPADRGLPAHAGVGVCGQSRRRSACVLGRRRPAGHPLPGG
jgi:hypothetical protein